MKRASRFAVVTFLCACGLAVSGYFARSAESDAAMQERIVANERAGLDALKTGDVERFASLLADDAVLVDDHGPASKAQVVKNVGEFRLLDYTMDDIRFVRIADQAGLIVYKLTEHGSSHGREFTVTVYVSTVCAQRAGKWQSLFSQETIARPPAKPAAAAPVS